MRTTETYAHNRNICAQQNIPNYRQSTLLLLYSSRQIDSNKFITAISTDWTVKSNIIMYSHLARALTCVASTTCYLLLLSPALFSFSFYVSPFLFVLLFLGTLRTAQTATRHDHYLDLLHPTLHTVLVAVEESNSSYHLLAICKELFECLLSGDSHWRNRAKVHSWRGNQLPLVNISSNNQNRILYKKS
eukprot:GHVS01054517.1.p1 GENE.GHVS01054517.1~~GHVS01054517.1.p1  ORF type:complete len:189 (-),score=21.72 GHVS01054517.1:77-643(-)